MIGEASFVIIAIPQRIIYKFIFYGLFPFGKAIHISFHFFAQENKIRPIKLHRQVNKVL